jgi:hypothetical protein
MQVVRGFQLLVVAFAMLSTTRASNQVTQQGKTQMGLKIHQSTGTVTDSITVKKITLPATLNSNALPLSKDHRTDELDSILDTFRHIRGLLTAKIAPFNNNWDRDLGSRDRQPSGLVGLFSWVFELIQNSVLTFEACENGVKNINVSFVDFILISIFSGVVRPWLMSFLYGRRCFPHCR